jgi:hypothetical protein
VPLDATMFTPCTKGKSNVAIARCGIVIVVCLEGPLEVMDSVKGMGSRATHQASVHTTRMQVQTPREEL